MTRKWPVRDTLEWQTQLGLSIVFAFVLGLSVVVPLNDCRIGGVGDVSDVLRTMWTITTGSATLVSFVLAVRKYRNETTNANSDEESRESHTAIHVESIEGDVDLSVTLGESRESTREDTGETRPEKAHSNADCAEKDATE